MLSVGGLSVLEHLASGHAAGQVDERLARRVAEAVRQWREHGALPHSVRELGATAADLGQLLLSHDPPPPGAADAWLEAALRTPPDGAASAPSPFPDAWQRDVLRVVEPLVAHARAVALDALSGLPVRHPELARAALRCWLAQPPLTAVRLATGAVVLDMHARKALGDGQDAGDWFRVTIEALCANRRDFLGHYPFLGRVLVSLLGGWADAGLELAVRLDRDCDDLVAWLGLDDLEVVAVETGLGDRHAGGRTVARVELSGATVAYKPRPVALLARLALLAERVAAATGERVELFTPGLLDRGDYGWLQWVPSGVPTDRAGLARYYRRLGELLAFAWAIGATDLHTENVIACGDAPYVVDGETLLAPAVAAAHEHPNPGAATDSVLATGILPDLRLDPEGEIAEELSAFAPDRSGPLVPAWQDPGFGSMRLRPVRAESLPPQSLPVLAGGDDVDPLEWRSDLLAGLRHGMGVLLAARAALAGPAYLPGGPRRAGRPTRAEAAVGLPGDLGGGAHEPARAPDWAGELFGGLRVRVVLRGTSHYAAALARAGHPAVLRNGLLVEGAFDHLVGEPAHERPEYAEAVAAAERAALLRFDVPLFWAEAGSRDLLLPDGSRLSGFFAASPVERMQERFAALDTSVDTELWAADAATECLRLNRTGVFPARAARPGPGPRAEPGSLLTDAAVAIGERLVRLGRHHGHEIAWLTMRSHEGERWRVVPMDWRLYDGLGGLLLLFGTLARLAPSDRFQEVATCLRRSWLSTDPERLFDSPGGMDGHGGDLFAATALHQQAPDDRLAGRASRLVGLLTEPADTGALDVIAGSAGAVLALCAAAGHFDGDLADRARSAAVAHGQRLVRALRAEAVGAGWPGPGGVALLGFAHGSAGIATALRALAAHDPPGAETYRECARQALDFESAAFDRRARNWPDWREGRRPGAPVSWGWCNGAAGIGLARALAVHDALGAAEAGRLHADLDNAVAASLRGGLGAGGASLCHGDMGVAELLLTAAAATRDAAHLDAAHRVAAQVARDVLGRNGRADAAIGPDGELPGLLNGAAGVAYQLLRMAQPDQVPPVLSLRLATEPREGSPDG